MPLDALDLSITHKIIQGISIENLSCHHYVAQDKGGNVLVYKRVHRYAVALLRNSRFYEKSNHVAVDPFIVFYPTGLSRASGGHLFN